MDATLDSAILARLAADAELADASIVVMRIEAGDAVRVGLDPERNLYPASMIKTPLVIAALAEVEAGRLSLDQRIPVSPSNMTFNDAPSPLHPGATVRLDEICDLAISRSDNVATNMLFDIVGRERATHIVRERFGLRATGFYRKVSGSDPLIADPGWDGTHRNAHPASDAAQTFALVALDRVPHSEIVRGALVRQYWNDKLTKGLLPGDRFAHKTGDTDDVTHDGGILITSAGRTYAIAAYTGMPSSEKNNARFAPFMRALRAYL